MGEGWLPQEERRAVWDAQAEQLRVVGWRPGPAGVSSLSVAPGLVVSIDHASPGTVTEVVVDADDGVVEARTRRALDDLFGVEAARVLADLPRRGARRPIALSDRYSSLWDHDAGPGHDALVSAILALDLAGDGSRSPEARAVALLEAVLPLWHSVRGLVGPIAAEGIARLAEADVVVDDASAQALDRLIDVAHRLAPSAVSEVDAERARRRVRRRRSPMRTSRSGPAPSPLAAAAAAPADRLEAAFLAESAAAPPAPAPSRGVPLPVTGDHRGWAWLDGGGNVGVETGAAAGRAWARVFRRHDRLLLGLAPARTGLVVIPPTGDASDLEVDLVDDPATPHRAPAHEAIRAAVLAGREAARHTRLGAPDADAAWLDCATRWEALGDVQRANLGRRHGRRDGAASRRRTSAGVSAFLADEL